MVVNSRKYFWAGTLNTTQIVGRGLPSGNLSRLRVAFKDYEIEKTYLMLVITGEGGSEEKREGKNIKLLNKSSG